MGQSAPHWPPSIQPVLSEMALRLEFGSTPNAFAYLVLSVSNRRIHVCWVHEYRGRRDANNLIPRDSAPPLQ
eukprot:117660-Lingulodinium_polyedra.AAC.1